MRNAKPSRSKSKRAPRPPRRAIRPDSEFELKRVIHELEVYQEEIRIQNQQLIESQRLLEDSRDRYANLYDFAPVAYVTLCAHGVIREINLTGANLFRVPRDRLVERPLVLFVEPQYRRSFLGHLTRCRNGLGPLAT